jgi:hypothetical protein
MISVVVSSSFLDSLGLLPLVVFVPLYSELLLYSSLSLHNERYGRAEVSFQVVRCLQITACGSFALEVPRRNLRSAVLVSGLKV